MKTLYNISDRHLRMLHYRLRLRKRQQGFLHANDVKILNRIVGEIERRAWVKKFYAGLVR